jgi:hypothetical protein
VEGKFLESLIASGPLAGVLGYAVITLWARLSVVQKELVECKDNCQVELKALAEKYEAKIEAVHSKQLELYKDLNEALRVKGGTNGS